MFCEGPQFEVVLIRLTSWQLVWPDGVTSSSSSDQFYYKGQSEPQRLLPSALSHLSMSSPSCLLPRTLQKDRLPVIETPSSQDLTPDSPARTPAVSRYTQIHSWLRACLCFTGFTKCSDLLALWVSRCFHRFNSLCSHSSPFSVPEWKR